MTAVRKFKVCRDESGHGLGSASPATTAHGALPPGYSRFKGPGGFSIGVPEGWKTSQAGHVVSVTDPANSNVSLLIAQAKSPSKDSSKDPLAGWQQQAGNPGASCSWALSSARQAPGT